MGKLKDIIIELELTKEELKDKDIQKFLLQVAYRKSTGKWEQFKNGNGYCEINKEDGTQITTLIRDKQFKAEFPLNCDMSISERCNIGCSFCYLGCTPVGKEADIQKFLNDKDSFLYTLHPGTELAINGNEPLHKDLELLLNFCKKRRILANLTVNEITLLNNKEILERWLKEDLIHGIGVSPNKYSEEMITWCVDHPTAVIHTIAGITTQENYNKLKNKNLKILILGYKNFGRGVDFKIAKGSDLIDTNLKWLKDNVKDFTKHFNVVSFDNLAIEQLDPKAWLSEEEYEKFYRGDDGSHTLYIDLVNETFAKNSVQIKKNHFPVKKDIRDMMKQVQEL